MKEIGGTNPYNYQILTFPPLHKSQAWNLFERHAAFSTEKPRKSTEGSEDDSEFRSTKRRKEKASSHNFDFQSESEVKNISDADKEPEL